LLLQKYQNIEQMTVFSMTRLHEFVPATSCVRVNSPDFQKAIVIAGKFRVDNLKPVLHQLFAILLKLLLFSCHYFINGIPIFAI
jgi:hypothetical protein